MPSARGSHVCAPGSRVIYSQREAIAPRGRSACDLCALNTPTGVQGPYTPIQKPPPKNTRVGWTPAKFALPSCIHKLHTRGTGSVRPPNQ